MSQDPALSASGSGDPGSNKTANADEVKQGGEENPLKPKFEGITKRMQVVVDEIKSSRKPTLVAVSKMKPSEAVKEAYDLGHRHFGENYVQELVKKSKELPKDIKWHFIGHLQSNKARHVVGIENLHMLETLDSVKLANIVNRISGEMDKKLKVLVQVNTSGESQKYGVSPADCVAMVKHVIENCQNLIFSGLMTIGDYSAIPKPDCFERLNACKTKVEKELGVDMSKKEMSMGMSADFELAIKLGSTSVRVGSALFGARDYSKKK